jgi:PAS domain S-box-containing protein
MCGFLAEAIKAEGYRPLTCTNPKEALAVSERETFGLAFIDINLPEMSGLDLASKLKEHDPLREMVFITGYGTFDIAVRAIKIGAYDYLGKPFSLLDLNRCLKRFQERQALREQVRQAEQRYFDLVQNIPLFIFLIRKNFQLDFVNDACSGMLGFTPKEALNTPGWFLDRIHPEDRERIKKQFVSAFESGKTSFSAETRLIHKNGHMIHTILKSIPRSGNKSDQEGDQMEGVIVDITDRVFLEKGLVQKEKLKILGAISGEVAHEIRNPLVSIGGFARRLQKKFPDLTEGAIIVNESRRLEKILDRIRNYLKPVEMIPQECSINKIISYCVELLSPEMERNGVTCQQKLDPGQSMIFVDRDIITEVFINLIRNAIKAMDEGGNLIIKTFGSDHNLYIDFKNNVRTKKLRDPEQLFLPFDEGGQSIGLPLCYKLIKNMGGLLSLDQEENYMTFTVSLPKTNGHVER